MEGPGAMKPRGPVQQPALSSPPTSGITRPFTDNVNVTNIYSDVKHINNDIIKDFEKAIITLLYMSAMRLNQILGEFWYNYYK